MTDHKPFPHELFQAAVVCLICGAHPIGFERDDSCDDMGNRHERLYFACGAAHTRVWEHAFHRGDVQKARWMDGKYAVWRFHEWKQTSACSNAEEVVRRMRADFAKAETERRKEAV